MAIEGATEQAVVFATGDFATASSYTPSGGLASPVEELVEVIGKKGVAAHQSNSQGAADADVLAKEAQAKEGACELFTG